MKIINFLPSNIKKKNKIKYIIIKSLRNIILVFLPIVIIFCCLEIYFSFREKQLEQLQQSNSYKNYQSSVEKGNELKLLSAEYQQYEKMNAYIDSLSDADIKDLDILSIPLSHNSYLTSFSSIAKENKISISGKAINRSAVTSYLEKLNNIKRYNNIILKELTNSNDSDISFSIELNIAEKKEEK